VEERVAETALVHEDDREAGALADIYKSVEGML